MIIEAIILTAAPLFLAEMLKLSVQHGAVLFWIDADSRLWRLDRSMHPIIFWSWVIWLSGALLTSLALLALLIVSSASGRFA